MDQPIARDNGRNEVFRGLLGDETAAGRAFLRDTDRDVGISAERFALGICSVSVLTHEFGHVLGFDHARDASSVMFHSTIIAGSNCTSQDSLDREVAQLRELWGLD